MYQLTVPPIITLPESSQERVDDALTLLSFDMIHNEKVY